MVSVTGSCTSRTTLPLDGDGDNISFTAIASVKGYKWDFLLKWCYFYLQVTWPVSFSRSLRAQSTYLIDTAAVRVTWTQVQLSFTQLINTPASVALDSKNLSKVTWRIGKRLRMKNNKTIFK